MFIYTCMVCLYVYMFIYIYIHTYIYVYVISACKCVVYYLFLSLSLYIYIYTYTRIYVQPFFPNRARTNLVAIFYPFSQFCEINISLLSLQTQPNTAPNLFQRGVEYGKYACAAVLPESGKDKGGPSKGGFPNNRLFV